MKTRQRVLVGHCAYLRVGTNAEGVEEYRCLLRRGELCAVGATYPKGVGCSEAIAKTHIKTDAYWESLAKHQKRLTGKYGGQMRKDKTGGAFAGHNSERDRYLFCKRKRRYRTQKEAEQKRRNCEEKRGYALRVLYCPFCHGWHLTKKYAEKAKERMAIFEGKTSSSTT